MESEEIKNLLSKFLCEILLQMATLVILKDLIFRLKRNSGIICYAKGRAYSSPPLVRYIPRKALKKEENGATSLLVGPELSVGRFEFSNESGWSFLDSDDECLPTDANRGLNLGMLLA